ncbi:MAG: YceI family protein [Bacteroidetes bacterium]|nr:MAG: YceI family protein [Bacteroidota bacterium]
MPHQQPSTGGTLMNASTRLVAPLLAGLVVLTGWIHRDAPATYTFQSDSVLWFTGTSTLHDWACKTTTVEGRMTLQTGDEAAPVLEDIDALTVTIPVESIKCGNGIMENRLYETLQAETHPTITYELTVAEVTPAEGDATAYTVVTEGRLTVADSTTTVAMTITGKPMADGRFRFTGKTPLRMTEVGVEPPAFMNLKTGDEMTVHFNVVAAPEAAGAASNGGS